jgi:hypothetical protein
LQILRVVARSRVDAGPFPANLVPVRIQKVAAGCDETAAAYPPDVGGNEDTAGKKAAAGSDEITPGKMAAAGRDEATTGRKVAPGTIYDSSMNTVQLAVGQKVHIKEPIIVDPGMDFILIRLRS